MKSFKGTVNRKYPDGTAIPEKLPPAYELGNSSKNCANCEVYIPGTKFCKMWDAKVRPNYWCKKWIAIKN